MKVLFYVITMFLVSFIAYSEYNSASKMQGIFDQFDKGYEYQCAITHEDFIISKLKKKIKLNNIIIEVKSSCKYAKDNNLPTNPRFR